jgi:hypothetical protein
MLPVLKMRRTADMACVLCSSEHNPTDEDAVPKWLLRAVKVEEGSAIVSVREEHGAKREVKTSRRSRTRSTAVSARSAITSG